MEYATLKKKIAAHKVARAERDAAFANVWSKAWEAGRAAGIAHKPRVMVITDQTGNLIETVADGACGFAWLTVLGANKGFGHWLIKQGLAKRGYTGGAQVWISDYNQSYERKSTHADAMAESLRANDIIAYSDGRLD